MCQADGHFLLVQEGTETLLDDVAAILPVVGALRLIDVFGKQRDVAGSIREIDLLNKRIIVG